MVVLAVDPNRTSSPPEASVPSLREAMPSTVAWPANPIGRLSSLSKSHTLTPAPPPIGRRPASRGSRRRLYLSVPWAPGGARHSDRRCEHGPSPRRPRRRRPPRGAPRATPRGLPHITSGGHTSRAFVQLWESTSPTLIMPSLPPPVANLPSLSANMPRDGRRGARQEGQHHLTSPRSGSSCPRSPTRGDHQPTRRASRRSPRALLG